MILLKKPYFKKHYTYKLQTTNNIEKGIILLPLYSFQKQV